MAETASIVSAWESLFRAQVAVMRDLAAAFPTRDISMNEYDVLFNISTQPGHSVRLRDLNRSVLLSQPSVSRLVDRLVARNLLEKTADSDDGRGAVIHLTDTGFGLFRRVATDHSAAIVDRVGSRLDRDELTELAALCDKLRDTGGLHA